MGKRKTNAQFTKEVYSLVGNDYIFLEEYVNSKTKIKCRHNICEHEWDIMPNGFLSGSRCPICQHKINSLKKRKTNDEFISEVYDLVKDEYIFLERYVNNKTKIKCRHTTCGHEYYVQPSNFLSGKRCPQCAGNIKKTTRQFKKEVYELVGNEYEFLEEYKGANTKIKCKHVKCEYEWEIAPSTFIGMGVRCPQCMRPNYNMDTAHFKTAVHNLVGDEYSVLGEYIENSEKIKIKHNSCEHVFNMLPSNFLFGQRCPQCMRPNYNKDTKQFKQEVYELVGDEYEFLEEYENSQTKIRCRHNSCGHEYLVLPSNFLSGKRCPQCASSKGEQAIVEYLVNKNIRFQQEYSFRDCRNKNSLPFDFYLPECNLLIEYDGEQHFYPIDFAGKGEEWAEEHFKYRQQNDNIKNQYCKDNDIPLLRIPYWRLGDIEDILKHRVLT